MRVGITTICASKIAITAASFFPTVMPVTAQPAHDCQELCWVKEMGLLNCTLGTGNGGVVVNWGGQEIATDGWLGERVNIRSIGAKGPDRCPPIPDPISEKEEKVLRAVRVYGSAKDTLVCGKFFSIRKGASAQILLCDVGHQPSSIEFSEEPK